jgi:hypothetical protein
VWHLQGGALARKNELRSRRERESVSSGKKEKEKESLLRTDIARFQYRPRVDP